jgi:hypothetical protein
MNAFGLKRIEKLEKLSSNVKKVIEWSTNSSQEYRQNITDHLGDQKKQFNDLLKAFESPKEGDSGEKNLHLKAKAEFLSNSLNTTIEDLKNEWVDNENKRKSSYQNMTREELAAEYDRLRKKTNFLTFNRVSDGARAEAGRIEDDVMQDVRIAWTLTDSYKTENKKTFDMYSFVDHFYNPDAGERFRASLNMVNNKIMADYATPNERLTYVKSVLLSDIGIKDVMLADADQIFANLTQSMLRRTSLYFIKAVHPDKSALPSLESNFRTSQINTAVEYLKMLKGW